MLETAYGSISAVSMCTRVVSLDGQAHPTHRAEVHPVLCCVVL